MYEAAVLEAGSAAALKRWMDDHGYKYPDGMDEVCDQYIELGWCFVAERARVGGKANVDPKPDMREVDTKLPSGAVFDGHVQAMGFRFETDELVVPMRLGTYNDGDLHNVVYLLTDKPQKIRSIPEEYVVRQVAGGDLFRNLTEPLPLRIIGGSETDIPDWQRATLPQQRNPEPHNGVARDLFASDMLAVASERLSHPFEENEKQLLRIGEHFALRGPEIDKLNLDSLAEDRKQASAQALGDVKKMTLTVIDGDFPREVLSGKDLAFAEYQMPARRNKAEFYDAKTKQPAGKQEGVLELGHVGPRPSSEKVGLGEGRSWPRVLAAAGFALAVCFTGLLLLRRPKT
jgi:hypothetical protein